MSTYILGVSYTHDSSVVLLKQGIPVVGIQKERITRKKHDGHFTDLDMECAVNYCLNAEGITLKDISLVVENSPGVLCCKETKGNWFEKKGLKRYVISHHLAHAYAAYGASPYDECAILVIDGHGNFFEDITEKTDTGIIFPKNHENSYSERQSVYYYNNGMKLIRKDLGQTHKSFLKTHGLGQMYEHGTRIIFNNRLDSGKVMGLAPYGSEQLVTDIIKIEPSGELVFWADWTKQIKDCNLNNDFKYCANLSYTVQKELEKGILEIARWTKKKTNKQNLCFTGGVALNSVANRILLQEELFDSIFFLPASSDSGIALGCAYYGYLELLKNKKRPYVYKDYLGRKYSDKDIEEALKKFPTTSSQKLKNAPKTAARYIAQENIIGWFQGRSEFGPRALGNRSIICDPRKKDMKDILNKRVKFRETFRPFAPSVLEEKSTQYFNIHTTDPYMIVAPYVHEEAKDVIPAVVHIDGTARFQTVNRYFNSKYYDLISEFEKITSVPVVLNTSFNIKSEPIVETPEDAISCFLKTDIDILFLGDYIVKKEKNLKKLYANKKLKLSKNAKVRVEVGKNSIDYMVIYENKKNTKSSLSKKEFSIIRQIIKGLRVNELSQENENIVIDLINREIIEISNQD